MTEPRVSVVIPTRDRPDLLVRAVCSVLEQTLSEIELIVVDDSAAGTASSVVDALREERLTYLVQPLAGAGAARNAGANRARAEYLVFLDDDDILLPKALAIGAEYLDAHPQCGLAAGGYALMDVQGRTIVEAPPGKAAEGLALSDWLAGHHPVTSQWILRGDSYRIAGGFDEAMWGCQDTDLGVRLCLRGCPMAWLSEITCRRLIHGGASSQDPRKKELMLSLLARVARQGGVNHTEQAWWREAHARVHLSYAAVGYAQPGWLAVARNDLATAVDMWPALLEGRLPSAVAVFVHHSAVVDAVYPLRYLSAVFDNLPDNARSLQRYRRRAIGLAAARTVFLAHSWGDARILRRALWECVRSDPSWLRNRGIRSLLAEEVFGRKVMMGLMPFV